MRLRSPFLSLPLRLLCSSFHIPPGTFTSPSTPKRNTKSKVRRLHNIIAMMMKKTTLLLAAAAAYDVGTHAFAPAVHSVRVSQVVDAKVAPLHSSVDENNNEEAAVEFSAEEKEAVGNLVADEEWAGLSMELADVVRTAVVEDLKKNSRDFLGKDDYAVGDFSKEIDRRVKEEVAKMRDKDEYELGKYSVVSSSRMITLC